MEPEIMTSRGEVLSVRRARAKKGWRRVATVVAVLTLLVGALMSLGLRHRDEVTLAHWIGFWFFVIAMAAFLWVATRVIWWIIDGFMQ